MMKPERLKKPIYLDYNASTPLDQEVIEAMLPYLHGNYGNPSSSHWHGEQCREGIEMARQQVANLLNCSAHEIVFTSGGSESNNLAIRGIANGRKKSGNHIVTSQIEHPAVNEVCKYLQENGFDITFIPVDENGLVDPSDIKLAITSQTILISIMHANNEVGTIQPIAEISKIARENNIVMHTDAAQSAGKIPVDVAELGVDMLSIAAHKMYAPKGIGALYLKEGIELEKLIYGGGQEKGKRAGTENVLAIVGLGKACEIVKRDLRETQAHLITLRDHLHQKLLDGQGKITLNGHPKRRLPNTLNVSFTGLSSEDLISKLSAAVAVSAGAACHSNFIEISGVLKAMKVSKEIALSAVRFSVGKMTTKAELDTAAGLVNDIITK